MSEVATRKTYASIEFKKPQNLAVLKEMGETIKTAVANALPAFLRGQAPALMRALYTECQKQPALLNCTPESLFGCTIACGQLGLMLGGALGQAYLIPFKGKATLIPGYKGCIQLVNRSGQVGVISAKTVYDKDRFKVVHGTSPAIIHEPYRCETVEDVRGRKATDYYATCLTKQGPTFVTMTKAEGEYHREQFALSERNDRTRGKGTWYDHFDAMVMKTCIIKLCKYLPMSAELQTAVHIDEMADSGEVFDASFMFQEAVPHLTEAAEPTSKVDSLRDRLEVARGGKPAEQQKPVKQPDPKPDAVAEKKITGP